jgi:hypothetical protein
MATPSKKRIVNFGVLKYHVKSGDGFIDFRKDFEELDRSEQLHVLLNWISTLECLYDSKVPNKESWHRRIPKPNPFE